MTIEHIDHHPAGPSQLDSREFGDNWHDAMHKINANFRHLYEKVTGMPAVVNAENKIESAANTIEAFVDEAAHAKIAELESALASHGIDLETATNQVAHLEGVLSEALAKIDTLQRAVVKLSKT